MFKDRELNKAGGKCNSKEKEDARELLEEELKRFVH